MSDLKTIPLGPGNDAPKSIINQVMGLPAGVEANSKEHCEWLMVPRYEVIALDTSGRLTVGHIFYKWEYPQPAPTGAYIYLTNPENPLNGEVMKKEFIETMPHLFRRLEWRERREPEQMPGYLKTSKGKVMRVIKYEFETDTIWLDRCAMSMGFALSIYLPATLAEYEKGGGEK